MNPWYEKSFGEDYMLVYKHRDRQNAADEVGKMMSWLNLPKNSHVLDLCCGMGRHALLLTEAGYQVTGVDLSAALLRHARALDSNQSIRWVESDMRSLPCDASFIEAFDAVVNLFTSFGYFEEDVEQMQVLKQIRQALRPGGRFIIDYLNPQFVADHLVLFSEREVDGNTIKETRRIQNEFVTKEIIVGGPGRQTRRYSESVKLYSLERIRDMLNKEGLALDAVYGDYDEGVYDKRESPRMIMVGCRI